MFVAGGLIWANLSYVTVKQPASISYQYGWPTIAVAQSYGKTWIFYAELIGNIVIAVDILGAIWFVCERSIIWRATRDTKNERTLADSSQQHPRLQIHRASIVLLMLTTAGLIWANLSYKTGHIHGELTYFYGWPCNSVTIRPSGQWFLYYKPAITDIVIAVNILISVWYTCEWLIRRRAARKGA